MIGITTKSLLDRILSVCLFLRHKPTDEIVHQACVLLIRAESHDLWYLYDYNSILSLRLFPPGASEKWFDGPRRIRLLATSGEKSALRDFALVFSV